MKVITQFQACQGSDNSFFSWLTQDLNGREGDKIQLVQDKEGNRFFRVKRAKTNEKQFLADKLYQECYFKYQAQTARSGAATMKPRFFSRDGLVVCVIDYRGTTYSDTAKCSPSDKFNYSVGKALAFARALRNYSDTYEKLCRI